MADWSCVEVLPDRFQDVLLLGGSLRMVYRINDGHTRLLHAGGVEAGARGDGRAAQQLFAIVGWAAAACAA